MPKKARDYSKSCVYQICCRDPDIREIYVGSTIDLVKRRAQHKGNCNSPNNGKHNYPVYQYIRNNGGWENWEVVQIEKVVCETGQDLCQREREVFERLQPTLNACRPKVSQEETKERCAATTKAWQAANPERVKATKKAWCEANSERRNAMTKAWIEANPERHKANCKACASKRVVCEHCDKEFRRDGLKRHRKTKKCLAAQAAHNEYQLRNQEYINERKEITADLDLD
jgi:hypothetical protein